MNEKQIKSLLGLVRRLHKRKYPVLAIIIIAVASLLMNNNWLKNIFSPTAPNECKVLKIYDGDTMTLQCSEKSEKIRVRMYCIDTAEIRQKPWGYKARDYLRSITGETVRLVEINKDRYGRIVGEIYSGKVNLNLAQVQAGQAAVYDTYCKKPVYKLAENEAKKDNLGIWSESGIHQRPWEWRKQQRSKHK
jgi:endonuclease YncB( thermonuclease family)